MWTTLVTTAQPTAVKTQHKMLCSALARWSVKTEVFRSSCITKRSARSIFTTIKRAVSFRVVLVHVEHSVQGRHRTVLSFQADICTGKHRLRVFEWRVGAEEGIWGCEGGGGITVHRKELNDVHTSSNITRRSN
jgi:hypothetical protein